MKKGETGRSLQTVMGQNIRLLRGNLGLTIEKLAEKAQLSASYMAAIERGEKWPGADSIEQIARGLECAPFDLFRTVNYIPRDTSKSMKILTHDIAVAVNKFLRELNTSGNNSVKP